MDARTHLAAGRATSLRRGTVPTPTLSDVADLAGVSRATASRVINGIPAVSADARRRVQHAVAALGYVPDQAAVALARRRSRTP